MKIKHRYISYGAIILILIILSALPFFFEGFRNLASPTFIRNLLINSGIFGYVFMVLLLIASIPLPIPSTPIVLGGGYVYGTIVGSLLSLIGIVLGASVSFLLVRHFGRPLLEKMVDEHQIIHFNHVFKKRGAIAALISYAIPIFPSDAVSLVLGLTRISFGTFLGIVILGHIPRVLLINSLGGNIYSGLTLSTFLILLGTLIFVLIAAFREPLKRFFFKELHQIEKEVDKVEKITWM